MNKRHIYREKKLSLNSEIHKEEFQYGQINDSELNSEHSTLISEYGLTAVSRIHLYV